MGKKKVVLSLLIGLSMVIVGMIGYILGYYVKGMAYATNEVLRTYSSILFLDSLAFDKLPKSCSVAELIDTIESNEELCVSVIRGHEPYSEEFSILPATQEKMVQALQQWEKAKKKLHELKFYCDSNQMR